MDRQGGERVGERGGEQGRRLSGRAWLMVWFRCCSTYGRIYKDQRGTMYRGACPRCGARVQARVGPGGTSRRMFDAG